MPVVGEKKQMNIYLDPPAGQWQLAADLCRLTRSTRIQVAQYVNGYANRFGTGRIDRSKPIVATGHQAWLWHPGILAKDIAMASFARAQNAQMLHLVVDQDVNDAWQLTVPRVDGDALELQTLRIGQSTNALPTFAQPAADTDQLHRSNADFHALQQAISDLPVCDSLAQQLGVVLARLMEPYVGNVPLLFASDLLTLDTGRWFVERMLQDSRACITAYNTAINDNPQAGVAQLSVEPDRIELPLWFLQEGEPRLRVYADLADSKPMLTLETGEPIRRTATLAPKALLLTAIMRLYVCDLFIHGKGGGAYDLAMQQWIASWLDQPLAPMTVASSDLYLPFDVPVATREELHRSIWEVHHLPHNLHRTHPQHEQSQRKVQLLSAMSGTTDKRERAKLFREIHESEAALQTVFAEDIEAVRQQLARHRIGLQNQAIAQKRDWPFILYASEQLTQLKNGVEDEFTD